MPRLLVGLRVRVQHESGTNWHELKDVRLVEAAAARAAAQSEPDLTEPVAQLAVSDAKEKEEVPPADEPSRTELAAPPAAAAAAAEEEREARLRALLRRSLIGREEFEISKAEARLAEQRLDFAKARIKQAEANVRAAVTRVDASKAVRDASSRRYDAQAAAVARAIDMASKTVIRAPLSGLITACNVEKGERAVPGIQSNPVATLMTIADMSVIEAEIEVDEADIVSVELGAKAEVEVDAIRDLQLSGVVTEIGQSPIQSADNQEGKEFKVVVRLAEPPEALRPGFTATAEIETATRTDCLVIPLQALTVRERERGPDGELIVPPKPVEGQEDYVDEVAASRKDLEEVEGVFVLMDGVARFRPVRTGITGDMDIEVLEGLTSGQEVVVGPYQKLRKLSEWDRAVVDEKRQKAAASARRP